MQNRASEFVKQVPHRVLVIGFLGAEAIGIEIPPQFADHEIDEVRLALGRVVLVNVLQTSKML